MAGYAPQPPVGYNYQPQYPNTSQQPPPPPPPPQAQPYVNNIAPGALASQPPYQQPPYQQPPYQHQRTSSQGSMTMPPYQHPRTSSQGSMTMPPYQHQRTSSHGSMTMPPYPPPNVSMPSYQQPQLQPQYLSTERRRSSHDSHRSHHSHHSRRHSHERDRYGDDDVIDEAPELEDRRPTLGDTLSIMVKSMFGLMPSKRR